MKDNAILKGLNTQQREAVCHTIGPSIILAGAGSGKTRVLIQKVLYLIENGVTPDSIVMITFTNKAATEMKERIARSYRKTRTRLGYIGTFHSFCAQILRKVGWEIGIDRNYVIYDDQDQLNLIKSILKDYNSKKLTPSYVQFRISAAKNAAISPVSYISTFSDYNASTIANIYSLYEKKLAENSALDFDDLIMKAITLFGTRKHILDKYQQRFLYFLIDEFQDTNGAQYILARQLASKNKNISVVGDFSQSIYSWRGADIRNLERFKEDFSTSTIYLLEKNYRSTQKILNYAYQVISKNQTHPILKLETDNFQGEDVVIFEAENEQEEAIFAVEQIREIRQSDASATCCVLYRTNAQSRVLEEAFLNYGIPYLLVGGTRFYERKEIKDVLSYFRLILNPKDGISYERIKKLGKNRLSRFTKVQQSIQPKVDSLTTGEIMERMFEGTAYLELYNPDDPEDYSRLENLKELKSVAVRFPVLHEFLEQVALVESEYFEGEKRASENGVKLMTLHQAKGLEFEYVFISGVEEGILPHARSIDDLFELEEERRLFYVGITRARKKLFLTYTQRRFIFGRRIESVPSRFLEQP